MIDVLEFKKQNKELYNIIIDTYGGKSNIFDMQSAIFLYLNNCSHPICSICGNKLAITKKFRNLVTHPKCSKHTNTNIDLIISPEFIYDYALTTPYKINNIPDKLLTKSDCISIKCDHHGIYNVKIVNFLNGAECQQCYHKSRIGSVRGSHTTATKHRLSIAKQGKSLNLSQFAKENKSLKQKQAWALRKLNNDQFTAYLDNLSKRRKEYIKLNGLNFCNTKITSLELKFKKFLDDNNIQYEFQYVIAHKKFDFYIQNMQLLVEVDGEYWHRLAPSIKNDIEKHKICIDNGIELLRISSDNYVPEIIFSTPEIRKAHTTSILHKRGINGF